jgi:hypothetical protein
MLFVGDISAGDMFLNHTILQLLALCPNPRGCTLDWAPKQGDFISNM